MYEQLAHYISSGGIMPTLMIGCASLVPLIVIMEMIRLWRHNSANSERMRTLDAIVHITTPLNRRNLLCELQKRMAGVEGLFLEVALATPLGLVRSNRLFRILAQYRKKLHNEYFLLYMTTIGVVLLGLIDTVLYLYRGSILEAVFVNNIPSNINMTLMEAVMPFLFGLLLACPSIFLILLTRGWLHASVQQLEYHAKKFCQIPTGQTPADKFNANSSVLK